MYKWYYVDKMAHNSFEVIPPEPITTADQLDLGDILRVRQPNKKERDSHVVDVLFLGMLSVEFTPTIYVVHMPLREGRFSERDEAIGNVNFKEAKQFGKVHALPARQSFGIDRSSEPDASSSQSRRIGRNFPTTLTQDMHRELFNSDDSLYGWVVRALIRQSELPEPEKTTTLYSAYTYPLRAALAD